MNATPQQIREMMVRADLMLKRKAVTDLYTFVVCMIQVIENVPMIEAPHVRLLCRQLEDLRAGRSVPRLGISIPPGNLKSMLVSVGFPAWVWLTEPRATFLALSGTPKIAGRDSRKMRRLILSDWYQSIVEMLDGGWALSMNEDGSSSGRVRQSKWMKTWELATDQNEKMNFENTAGGGRACLSINAAVTGDRAKYIIVDDPVDVKEARIGTNEQLKRRMEEVNEKVRELETRKPVTGGLEIRIMQRLHDDDPIGAIIDNPMWNVVVMQAEYTPGYKYNHPDDWRTEKGEPLAPRLQSRKKLEEMRFLLGEASYATQYQQTPVAKGATLFSGYLEGIEYEGPPEAILARADEVGMTIDCGNTVGNNSDPTSCRIWAKIGLDMYLIGGWKRKYEFPDLVQAVRETIDACPSLDFVMVEDKAAGTQLLQLLTSVYPQMFGVNPSRSVDPERKGSRDKVSRARVSTLVGLVARHIWIPARRYMPDVGEWLSDHESFPMGSHDDDVDSTSQIVEYWQYHDRNGSDAAYESAWEHVMGY